MTDEDEIEKYIVEKSSDGKSFTSIGEVTGDKSKKYIWYDENANNAVNYYRLKMLSVNNKISYSAIVLLKARSNTSIQVFPNPFTDKLSVHYDHDGDLQQGRLMIKDIFGRVVFDEQVMLQPGSNEYAVSLAARAAGVYYLFIKDDKNRSINISIVKN